MLCDYCGKDYAEEFATGIKCFGCGKWEWIAGPLAGKNHSKKPIMFDLNYVPLCQNDYDRIWNNWLIEKEQADTYGWHKGCSKSDDRTWLVFPIFDKYGGPQLLQLRHWDGSHGTRFYTCRAKDEVPDGTVWRSWYTTRGDDKNLHFGWWKDRQYTHVAITEGIPDAIRVSEIMPSVALIGSSPDPAKVEELKKLNCEYLIMLDNDAFDKSLKLQRALGVSCAKILQLPKKDPASLTSGDLYDIIRGVVGERQ